MKYCIGLDISKSTINEKRYQKGTRLLFLHLMKLSWSLQV